MTLCGRLVSATCQVNVAAMEKGKGSTPVISICSLRSLLGKATYIQGFIVLRFCIALLCFFRPARVCQQLQEDLWCRVVQGILVWVQRWSIERGCAEWHLQGTSKCTHTDMAQKHKAVKRLGFQLCPVVLTCGRGGVRVGVGAGICLVNGDVDCFASSLRFLFDSS